MVGTFGDAGSYSFQASKLMTGGEGGTVVSTSTERVASAYGDVERAATQWSAALDAFDDSVPEARAVRAELDAIAERTTEP